MFFSLLVSRTMSSCDFSTFFSSVCFFFLSTTVSRVVGGITVVLPLTVPLPLPFPEVEYILLSEYPLLEVSVAVLLGADLLGAVLLGAFLLEEVLLDVVLLCVVLLIDVREVAALEVEVLLFTALEVFDAEAFDFVLVETLLSEPAAFRLLYAACFTGTLFELAA